MNWLDKLKDVVTEDVLYSLLKGAEEGSTIDFNEYIPKSENSNKEDWFGICKLAGAFVNAQGGVILLGIKEVKGTFSEVVGISIENWERFQKHIIDKLRSLYDPVIESVFLRRMQLASGKYVVMIVCPVSDNLHQLKTNGQSSMFPKRVGTDVVPMTTAEVVGICLKRNKQSEIRVEQRKERIDALIADSGDFNIKPPGWILYVVPDQSNICLKTSDWSFQQIFRALLNSLVGRDGGIVNSQYRLCSEGLIFFTDKTKHLLIKRDGGLELVCSDIEGQQDSVICFGEWTRHSFVLLSHLLVQLSTDSMCYSWHLAATFVGVKGKRISRGIGIFPYIAPSALPRDRYDLDFIKLEISQDQKDLVLQMEKKYYPMLEQVWNDANASMPSPLVEN